MHPCEPKGCAFGPDAELRQPVLCLFALSLSDSSDLMMGLLLIITPELLSEDRAQVPHSQDITFCDGDEQAHGESACAETQNLKLIIHKIHMLLFIWFIKGDL